MTRSQCVVLHTYTGTHARMHAKSNAEAKVFTEPCIKIGSKNYNLYLIDMHAADRKS